MVSDADEQEPNMTESGYDVIVVGARCAGSPVAMLLARAGYRVLVVDRATFPSDTISTHLIHPPGVAALLSVVNPRYLQVMFSDPRGHMMLAGGAVLMTVGTLVMRKMINFKF